MPLHLVDKVVTHSNLIDLYGKDVISVNCPSVGRRYGKRRSPSLSSPRQSPGRYVRREKSPVFEGCRISPRPSADNTHSTSKRHGKRPKLSRTPSPEQRYSKSG